VFLLQLGYGRLNNKCKQKPPVIGLLLVVQRQQLSTLLLLAVAVVGRPLLTLVAVVGPVVIELRQDFL
jgi:hypothetical protein